MGNFAENLKRLRKSSKLTQGQLAQQINCSRSLISLYETGQRLPSFMVLAKLSKIFKTSVDELIGNMPVEADNQVDLSSGELLEVAETGKDFD